MFVKAAVAGNGEASVKSAARAIDIVEYVAGAASPPTAQSLADVLAIPVSSLSYLLATLVARGWLSIGERRGYALGPELSGLLSKRLSSAERAKPIVREIRMQLNETCGYYEARGTELIALVCELGQQALNFTLQVGERGPLHAFAAGKVLLAFGPREREDAYLAQRSLERFTAQTLTEPKLLRADLDRIRKSGFALAEGEHTPGLVTLAVPIQMEQLGAISVAVPAARWNDVVGAQVKTLLTKAQRALGNPALGPDPQS